MVWVRSVAVAENRPGSGAGRATSPSPERLGQQHSFKTLSFTITPAGEGIRPIGEWQMRQTGTGQTHTEPQANTGQEALYHSHPAVSCTSIV